MHLLYMLAMKIDWIGRGGDLPACRVIPGCADHRRDDIFSESNLVTG